MNIKWTAGPGPAPLPYSKRAREAMGVTDDVSRNYILESSVIHSEYLLLICGIAEMLYQVPFFRKM